MSYTDKQAIFHTEFKVLFLTPEVQYGAGCLTPKILWQVLSGEEYKPLTGYLGIPSATLHGFILVKKKVSASLL